MTLFYRSVFVTVSIDVSVVVVIFLMSLYFGVYKGEGRREGRKKHVEQWDKRSGRTCMAVGLLMYIEMSTRKN